jgi:hypothetical protein
LATSLLFANGIIMIFDVGQLWYDHGDILSWGSSMT